MYDLVAMATTRRMSHHSTIDFSTFSLSHTANAIIQRFIFNQYSNNRGKKNSTYTKKYEKRRKFIVSKVLYFGLSSVNLLNFLDVFTWFQCERGKITVPVFFTNFLSFYFSTLISEKMLLNSIEIQFGEKKSTLTIQTMILLTLFSNVDCYAYNAIER